MQLERSIALSRKIKVNGGSVSKEYKLKDNDLIIHTTLRVENPIMNSKPRILMDNAEFIAVDKPSSWPVHVCGGYFINSLHKILEREYETGSLKVLHRLDKHTSGVVIFAKNSGAAAKFTEFMKEKKIKKQYYCRVKGDFDSSLSACSESIVCLNRNKGIFSDVTSAGTAGLDTPKTAETHFEKLFYDESTDTSVVVAKPRTGRTHQIRIHLKFLGFPIANDPCYGGEMMNDLGVDAKFIKKEGEETVSSLMCYRIWLHAFKYEFGDYSVETEEPEWLVKGYKIN